MSRLYSLFLLFIKIHINICTIPSFNHSNCSLLFQIRTIYHPNKIQTDFPLHLLGIYNSTCSIKNLTAYYKITPLSVLLIGKSKNEDEDVQSMIEVQTTNFQFSINQSSTIRLCILSIDEYRICRQIHIGVNKLDHFWNLPLKIFYTCLICSISIYYILYILLHKWCQTGHKSKSEGSLSNTRFVQQKNDTFENEKVYEDTDE